MLLLTTKLLTMKVLTGHLTATDKKAIKAILEAGMTSAKVGRKTFFLSVDNEGTYTVRKQFMNRGMIPCGGSPLRLSTYTSTFKH